MRCGGVHCKEVQDVGWQFVEWEMEVHRVDRGAPGVYRRRLEIGDEGMGGRGSGSGQGELLGEGLKYRVQGRPALLNFRHGCWSPAVNHLHHSTASAQP